MAGLRQAVVGPRSFLFRYLGKKVKSNNMKATDVTHKNISYGMTVDVLDKETGAFRRSSKVHFFNNKGVLVGHGYEWMPYERLRHRIPDQYHKDRRYHRFFYGQRFERIRNRLFRVPLWLTSALLRYCEPRLD